MARDERDILMDISEPDAGVVGTLAGLDSDVLMLGAGGKMGHGLALMARRALDQGKSKRRVLAVSRFSERGAAQALEQDGIETITCDLADAKAVERLPEAGAVVYLVGQKFGTGKSAALTWVLNCYVPGVVAQRWAGSVIAVFSSGNVYPFTPATTPAPGSNGGPTEDHEPAPIGEYAQSVLGRERIFEHFSRTLGTRVVTLRLNYAQEPRYGIIVDLAKRLVAGEAIDLTQGHVNVLWQGDCNRATLRSFALAASPPAILNLAGPQVPVREVATRIAKALGVTPRFTGTEAPTSLLSNGARCWQKFGPPRVSVDQMIQRIADYLREGGATFGKPTHFEARDGKF